LLGCARTTVPVGWLLLCRVEIFLSSWSGSSLEPRSLRAGPESPRSAALRRFQRTRSSIVDPERPRPVADTSLRCAPHSVAVLVS
jgi:hypothetical protein